MVVFKYKQKQSALIMILIACYITKKKGIFERIINHLSKNYLRITSTDFLNILKWFFRSSYNLVGVWKSSVSSLIGNWNFCCFWLWQHNCWAWKRHSYMEKRNLLPVIALAKLKAKMNEFPDNHILNFSKKVLPSNWKQF